MLTLKRLELRQEWEEITKIFVHRGKSTDLRTDWEIFKARVHAATAVLRGADYRGTSVCILVSIILYYHLPKFCDLRWVQLLG